MYNLQTPSLALLQAPPAASPTTTLAAAIPLRLAMLSKLLASTTTPQ
jgi:hypothetical protein